MARPIEPTPVLEGEDALRLLKEVAGARFNANKQRFLEECKQIHAKTK